MNGSSSTGGCQPESCIMMPITHSTTDGCDCPGNTPVNGTLIDGVIPSIDTTRGWASELFTVNRNGRDSIMIGFWFLSEFSLRGIEIAAFHCPVLGIGITGVKVYFSFVFPDFISTASPLLVTHSSTLSDNCQSLSTVSFPIESSMASQIYFIEFLFTGGSSVSQLNWLYLGEIRFSNMSPTATIFTTQLGNFFTKLYRPIHLDLFTIHFHYISRDNYVTHALYFAESSTTTTLSPLSPTTTLQLQTTLTFDTASTTHHLY